ncbi:hypothetical protein ACFQZX_12075 [Mucilaginibacter litoreus]|uniref:Uncharacterized protein n=1 Tax=Mucilaginibacter litoreus TaxID=1048221 RepID=A0ABW3AUY8_9SPHI
MKQQEVFRKTGAIIKELLDQYEYLQSTADELNDLELELFVANTHFLKDHAEILRKLNLQRSQQQQVLPPHVDEIKPEIMQQECSKPEIVAPEVIKIEPVKEEAFKPDALRFEGPKIVNEEPKYFEPLVHPVKPVTERPPFRPEPEQPIKPVQAEEIQFTEEKPVPHIDLQGGADKDSYAFERSEPEISRPELTVNEADTFTFDRTQDTDLPIPEKKVAAEVPVLSEDLPQDKPADETEQPNIVPSNPEPVIDNTSKTQADQPAPQQQPSATSLADLYKTEPVKEERPLTLNERLRAQQGGATTQQPQQQGAPIQDLKSAISLNDKLLFVKDLFNGYSLAYSEAIEIVNRFNSFEEADRFLRTNYVAKNNWEAKQATADKFYALLKRRYA